MTFGQDLLGEGSRLPHPARFYGNLLVSGPRSCPLTPSPRRSDLQGRRHCLWPTADTNVESDRHDKTFGLTIERSCPSVQVIAWRAR